MKVYQYTPFSYPNHYLIVFVFACYAPGRYMQPLLVAVTFAFDLPLLIAGASFLIGGTGVRYLAHRQSFIGAASTVNSHCNILSAKIRI